MRAKFYVLLTELHANNFRTEKLNFLGFILFQVEKEIEQELTENGNLKDAEEDIHSVIECRLFKHSGDAAFRLHTARSRNDQSATDTRLWMLASLPKLTSAIVELITVG